jgi:hypothetical protein
MVDPPLRQATARQVERPASEPLVESGFMWRDTRRRRVLLFFSAADKAKTQVGWQIILMNGESR